MCWNITRVSLWLLCNVHFVQSTQRTRLRDVADLKARIIAAVKNIDAPMLTRVWQELEYRIDVCRVIRGAHIENLQLGGGSFPVAVNNSINPLNPELNPICYLLALLGAHHFLHVSRIRVKLLTFRLLMSYI